VSGKPDVKARRAFLEQARSLTPYLVTDYEGTLFVLPTDADKQFFVKQRRKDLRILGDAVATLRRRGRLFLQTFVDVGAHVGTTTISALAHHGFSHAVAIEPDPGSVRLLKANAALNGLDGQVTVVEAGISDAPGSAWFLPGDPESGPCYWTKGSIVPEPSPRAVEIELVTLEQLTKRGYIDPGTTGLVWLDCQKREGEALRAASPFLEHRVPIVFVLRAMYITPPSPFLRALRESYETFVDLRRKDPTDRKAPWRPVFESLDELLERRAAYRALTDVLAF
jgi:FkbM family methyltransferase